MQINIGDTIICFEKIDPENCWTGVVTELHGERGIFRKEQGRDGHWFGGFRSSDILDIVHRWTNWNFIKLDDTGNTHKLERLAPQINKRVIRD